MENKVNFREEVLVSGLYATCVEFYRDVLQMRENSVFERRIKILQTQKKNRQMYTIAKIVSEYYQYLPKEVANNELDSRYIEPRQIIIYLYKELTELAPEEIINFLHISDRCVIFYAYYQIHEEVNRNEVLRKQISEMTDQIEKAMK